MHLTYLRNVGTPTLYVIAWQKSSSVAEFTATWQAEGGLRGEKAGIERRKRMKTKKNRSLPSTYRIAQYGRTG